MVAQVCPNGPRKANLARILAGTDTESRDSAVGRSIGEGLAMSNTSDVVGGHIGLIVKSGDTVLTSDTAGIKKVLDARGIDATVHGV